MCVRTHLCHCQPLCPPSTLGNVVFQVFSLLTYHLVCPDLPAGTAQGIVVHLNNYKYSQWRCAVIYPLVIAPGSGDTNHCQNQAGNAMSIGDWCVSQWSDIHNPGTSVNLDPVFRPNTKMCVPLLAPNLSETEKVVIITCKFPASRGHTARSVLKLLFIYQRSTDVTLSLSLVFIS